MRSIRGIVVQGTLAACVTVVSLTFPVSVPWALLFAVAIIVHDGPLSRASGWLAGWLLLLEFATASPLGTLSLPFCLMTLLLTGARRFISLGFWGEHAGWSLADGLRAVIVAVVFGVVAVVLWVLTGILDTVPLLADRFRALSVAVPVILLVPPVSVVLVRASTEPFRRAIIFSGT
jgi:hypothetical protein